MLTRDVLVMAVSALVVTIAVSVDVSYIKIKSVLLNIARNVM